MTARKCRSLYADGGAAIADSDCPSIVAQKRCVKLSQGVVRALRGRHPNAARKLIPVQNLKTPAETTEDYPLDCYSREQLVKARQHVVEVNVDQAACSLPDHLALGHAPEGAPSELYSSSLALHNATARSSSTSGREDPSVSQSLRLRAMALRRARFGGLGSMAERLGNANWYWPQL